MASPTSPLYAAAESGNVGLIETLVHSGNHPIDAVDIRGDTAMHAAASRGHVEAIEVLFRLGSRAIDLADNFGATPMHFAALKGHVQVIETLVHLGSRTTDTPDSCGCTPLHMAAQFRCIGAIETLVRLGSKAIDTPGKHNLLPLSVLLSTQPFSREVVEGAKVLRALGAHANAPIEGLSDDILQLLRTDVDEDEALQVRFRVFFAQKLVHRLLDLPFSCTSPAESVVADSPSDEDNLNLDLDDQAVDDQTQALEWT